VDLEGDDRRRCRMAGSKLVSPSAYRALNTSLRGKIFRALERQGLDHAMYAFVDDAGNLTKVVPCCTPSAPCPPDAFRIRRRMPPASREATAAAVSRAQAAARLAS